MGVAVCIASLSSEAIVEFPEKGTEYVSPRFSSWRQTLRGPCRPTHVTWIPSAKSQNVPNSVRLYSTTFIDSVSLSFPLKLSS